MGRSKLILLALVFILLTAFVQAQARESVFSIQEELRIDLIRIDPSPLLPGSTSEIVLEVTNLKDIPLFDNDFEIAPEFPLFPETPKINIPVLQPGVPTELRFKIRADPAAKEGLFRTTLRYDVKELDVVGTARINVTVKRSQTLVTTIVSMSPERVEPGKEATLRLKLRNSADSSLKDVTMKLDFLNGSAPFAPVRSTSERVIKNLRAGAEEEVEFRLLAAPDAELDVYRLPLEISFFDAFGKSFKTYDVVGVIVDAVPEYQIYLDEQEVYIQGDKGKVSLSLSNIGVSEMKFITVSLLESEDYAVLSRRTTYIGNLESDDFEGIDFEIFVKKKEGVVPLKVLMQYKDVYNTDRGEQLEVPLTIYSRSEAVDLGLKSDGKGTFIAIGVIILLVVGVIIYRKRKKLKILS